MQKKMFLLGMLSILLLLPASLAFAQEENANPSYVRYCTQTRRAQGEDGLTSAFSDVDTRLIELEEFLAVVDTGNLTFIEAVTTSESFLTEWQSAPAQAISCLKPLERDMTVMYQEVLIAMLYGLNVKPTESSTHLAVARGLVDQIKLESSSAVEFLTIPLPPEEPVVVEEEPTPEAEVVAETRTPETINAELDTFLRDNQISVLRNISWQEFPDGSVVTIQLDRFVSASGEDFDYDNSIFTLDKLVEAISEWEETAGLQTIRIQTFDGDLQTLSIDINGANFRAHYLEGSLNRDAFLATFAVVETPAPEATPS